MLQRGKILHRPAAVRAGPRGTAVATGQEPAEPVDQMGKTGIVVFQAGHGAALHRNLFRELRQHRAAGRLLLQQAGPAGALVVGDLLQFRAAGARLRLQAGEIGAPAAQIADPLDLTANQRIQIGAVAHVDPALGRVDREFQGRQLGQRECLARADCEAGFMGALRRREDCLAFLKIGDFPFRCLPLCCKSVKMPVGFGNRPFGGGQGARGLGVRRFGFRQRALEPPQPGLDATFLRPQHALLVRRTGVREHRRRRGNAGQAQHEADRGNAPKAGVQDREPMRFLRRAGDQGLAAAFPCAATAAAARATCSGSPR